MIDLDERLYGAAGVHRCRCRWAVCLRCASGLCHHFSKIKMMNNKFGHFASTSPDPIPINYSLLSCVFLGGLFHDFESPAPPPPPFSALTVQVNGIMCYKNDDYHHHQFLLHRLCKSKKMEENCSLPL